MFIFKASSKADREFSTAELFPRKRMMMLLIPLVIEQTLAVTIGFADTIMVSSLGENAVSSVSLVDQINQLLVAIFSALATGGAVVASQYLGRYDSKNAGTAAKQLLYISLVASLFICGVSLGFNRQILGLVFGKITPEVMGGAMTYYYITAASYPFLALYSAGAAIFRATGNSRVSMVSSFIMNLINICGNALLIYGFKIGVAGAGIATLFSRIVGAVIMLVLLCRPMPNVNTIRIERLFRPELRPQMVKSILKVGVPTGLENSMFQIGKLCVAGIITTFGTASIAANAICSTIANIAIIPGSAVNLGLITVVGQCVGAGDYKQAQFYTRRMLTYSYTAMGITNCLIFIFAPQIAPAFNLSDEALKLAIGVIRTYTPLCALIHPISFGLPNTLRAAGDARFTMIVSIISMWTFRIGFSYLLALALNLGLYGVWYAMYIDWVVRSTLFIARYRGGKWRQKRVI